MCSEETTHLGDWGWFAGGGVGGESDNAGCSGKERDEDGLAVHFDVVLLVGGESRCFRS
jgi:hypothetical protein